MNLPRNKDGKIYLLDKEGKEVKFDHPIDAIEALFGIFGKDDKEEDFEPRFFLPDGFDARIRTKKTLGASKEERMVEQISRGKRGRPPKEKVSITKEPVIEMQEGSEEKEE